MGIYTRSSFESYYYSLELVDYMAEKTYNEKDKVKSTIDLLSDKIVFNIIYELLHNLHGTATIDELQDVLNEDSSKVESALDRIQDRLIKENDDGEYEMYPTTGLLYRYVAASTAGTYPESPQISSTDTGSHCYQCGEQIDIVYEDEVVTIKCTNCDYMLHQLQYPPKGAINRSSTELIEAFDKRTRKFVALSSDGICPWCSGRMEQIIKTEDDLIPHSVWIDNSCTDCGGHMSTTIGEIILSYPEVISFYYQNGIDINNVRTWEVDMCMEDITKIISEDPLKIKAVIQQSGNTMELVLDRELVVIDKEISKS